MRNQTQAGNEGPSLSRQGLVLPWGGHLPLLPYLPKHLPFLLCVYGLGIRHSGICKGDASILAPAHDARPWRSILRDESLGWELTYRSGVVPTYSTVVRTHTHTHALRQDYNTVPCSARVFPRVLEDGHREEWLLFLHCPLIFSPLLLFSAPQFPLPPSLLGPFPVIECYV